jgi:sugar lactone lactonase YvrE
MVRTFSVVAICAVFAAALAAGVSAAKPKHKPFPEVIQLQPGFGPEGIEIKGNTFYVGSVATGAIFRGDLRTGGGGVFIPGGFGRPATGLELVGHRLFVAGAGSGKAYVYDTRTPTAPPIKEYNFGAAPPNTFINDVVVTPDAAYFTDSRQPAIYRVPIGPGGALGNFQTMPLGGDYVHVAGQLNLNGVDATPSGKWLIAVQTAGGKLYRIDPQTGVAKLIDLGGATVPFGDGILLKGRTLYVVQNQLNKVAVVRLSPDLASGRIVKTLTDSDLVVPTTIDDHGKRLYTVNAKFGAPNPNNTFEVVQLRSKGH